MTAALVFLLLVVLASLSAQTQKSKPRTSTPSLSNGRQTFEWRCAACHGLDGRGGEHAPDIVTSPSVLALSDQAVLQIVRDGIRRAGMPAFRSFLSPAEIRAVVAYIRDAGKSSGGSRVVGDPAKGHLLFFGKAGCSDCHMIGGKGGFLGLDLSDYGRHHSVVQTRRAILRPNDSLSPDQQAVTVTTRGGQEWTGLIRNEDNFSLQLLDAQGVFHFVMKQDLASVERKTKSLMPDDYGSRFAPAEVDDLVSYLSARGR